MGATNLQIYCPKCRTKTDTLNPIPTRTINNKVRMIGTCTICSTNKSQFVSNKHIEGGKLDVQNFLSKIPLTTTGIPEEKHLGFPGFGTHSFTGQLGW